jgi:threonine dehydrogenase-like Zn-dependent dehydrogenase
MQGTMIYGPRDIRFEDRPEPAIIQPTDAIIRLSATCICGSDLWPYRGIAVIAKPTPMGHEYCGIVEGVGRKLINIKPGQFAVGSFATSDNSCVICRDGYQSSCVQREFMSGRKIDPGKVFDLTLPLDQVAAGYRAMDERRAIKTLLQPRGDL